MDARNEDLVVVGGGLAGLAAAAAAGAQGRSVLLLDTQGNGGRAATEQVGRYRFNRGGHALYKKGPGRQVLRDLGVAVHGVAPPVRGAQGRLGERTGLLPVGALSLARTRLLGRRDKAVLGRMLATAGRWRPETLADLTAGEWFDRLGLDGLPREAAAMLTRLTTYSADVDVISADVVAAQVQSAIDAGVEYLHQGWSSLVDGLTAAAERHGVRIEASARVQQVVAEDGRVRVELEDGAVHGRRVVLAAGSPAANAALRPDDPPASWATQGPASRTACLDLGMRDVPPTQFLLGLDRAFYLSCHAPVAAGLAPRGGASVQLMWYLGAGDEPSKDEAMDEFTTHCRLAGVEVARAEETRYLHRMVASSAQPTPSGGGLRGRPGVADTGLPGVFIAGDWVGPEGYLADASLTSGLAAARTAVDSLDHAPTTKAVA